MNNYTDSKRRIESIRNYYGEMAFRAGISHLMDVGIRHFDADTVEKTCEKIMQEDDSNHIMTNNFKCDIIMVAHELAQIPHIELLVYIQREVDYDMFDGCMSYRRLKKILVNCLSYIEEDHLETLDTFEHIGLKDDEIEALGFGYLLDLREEE